MRIITIEEHIPGAPLSGAAAKYADAAAPYYGCAAGPGLPYNPDPVIFGDVGAQRIADMDKYGIDMQILSVATQSGLLPKQEAAPIVRETNDRMAQAISAYPDRFAGFAALPWSNPEAAARELERAMKIPCFKGAILAGRPSAGTEFLDAPRFTPVLEAAEALNAPIYIHPAPPSLQVQEIYYAGLGDQLSARLSLYGWGWHNEAGIQILRMILSGAFERFPKLQIIGGHWGEMVPFFLSRLDQALPQSVTGLERSITETFRRNVYITPSGIFDEPQLRFCMDVVGADRIIHSVDCPFISNAGAKPFLEMPPFRKRTRKKSPTGMRKSCSESEKKQHNQEKSPEIARFQDFSDFCVASGASAVSGT